MTQDGTTTGGAVARAALGWVLLVPALALLTAWLSDFTGLRLLLTIVLLIVLVGTARQLMRSADRGVLWLVVTWLVAIGVAAPTVLGANAYVAVRGQVVTAVVSEEISVTSRRLADAATGADLGILPGTRGVTGAGELGDTLTVLVAPGFDPLPVSRAGTGTTALQVWVLSWLVGAVLVAARLVLSRRAAARV